MGNPNDRAICLLVFHSMISSFLISYAIRFSKKSTLYLWLTKASASASDNCSNTWVRCLPHIQPSQPFFKLLPKPGLILRVSPPEDWVFIRSIDSWPSRLLICCEDLCQSFFQVLLQDSSKDVARRNQIDLMCLVIIRNIPDGASVMSPIRTCSVAIG